MKKNWLITIGILILLNIIIACTAKKNRINIAGSTTALPIIQAAAETYMQKNPEVNISVRGGGSSIGIKSIINRIIDIGSASRPISSTESELALREKNNLMETAIAKDAISIIVHQSNPVNNLTMGQLKQIYAGEITNWKELGGNDKKIIVVSRDVSSGSFEVFNQVVLDTTKVKKDAMMLASNNAVATNVSYTPGAIGYIGLGYMNENLKILSIDDILPNKETARTGEYILTRKLYMYTSATPNQLTRDFIQFILSEEGQQIVEQQGYVRIR